MYTPAATESFDVTDDKIAKLLCNRYGDGYVYISSGSDANLLKSAVEQEFVSCEGYITRKGRQLLARYHFYSNNFLC